MSNNRCRSARRMKTPAAITHDPTMQMIRLASAFTSGLTPNFTFE
jgi:hypothetical protein